MTSNIGAADITDNRGRLGFAGQAEDRQAFISQRINAELKHSFKPEFLNRLDETIVFRQLNNDDLALIAAKLLGELSSRMAKSAIECSFSPAVAQFIAESSHEPGYGARPLRRSIQTSIEDVIAERLLRGDLQQGGCIKVDVEDNNIVFSVV